MKSKIFFVAIATFTLGVSCSKSFLEQDPPNSISIDKNFQTENDISLAVSGVYQALRTGNAVGEGSGTWTDDRSDDVNSTDNQSNNGEPFQFTAFALSPSNTYLYSHWVALYNPISRANLVLSQIDKIAFSNEATKNQYIAELKFIRAFMYFNLVKEFGEVPVVTERLNNPDEAKAITRRESRETVYQQIIADLKDVITSSLPVIQPAAGKGRVSMQAANGLLGKVYLTMAASGVDVSNSNANLNNAKTYLLACYNQRTFANLADIPFADVFDVSKKSTNAEIIWQISNKQGDPTYSSAIARNNQARGETINSLVVSTGVGGTLSADLRKEFETGDKRTEYSIKYAAHPSVQDYFITKFRDVSATAGTLGYGGNDWILLRYADIILCLAEAHMRLNENAMAITYLDMVRTRAGMPGYIAMMNIPAYASRYPTLKLAILHERRVELAFEHHRWHDLVRFFNPSELVAYFKQKSQSDYNNSPLSNISEKDYYFPIPLNETRLDPEQMFQNPGY
ncbi:MAG TPA: RagB/SusD family nutrient uptake outer membrane protein [Flavitalea sp.]|nr:RagB/SusD family nutrient uptake outer membrane protein [Flavitalea sp.]